MSDELPRDAARSTGTLGVIPGGIPAMHRPARWAAAAAATCAALGLMVLVGWVTGVEAMRALIPGMIVMLPVTAIGMILGGAAVAVLALSLPRSMTTATWLGAAVLIIGIAATFERLTGIGLGFELLLFEDAMRQYPYRPIGRMATNSAISFVIAGGAILSLTRGTGRALRVADTLGAMGLSISALALLGYLYGVRPLYAIDQAAGMALVTAIAFALLFGGVLMTRPRGNSLGLVFEGDAGGVLLRRMLPASILPPIALGWLWLESRRLELVSREGGVALFVLLTITILTVTLYRSARLLSDSDERRAELIVRAEQARFAAEQASRAKSDFLATMSHELRTPLNAIIGFSSLMADGVPDSPSPAQSDQLGRMRIAASHLLRLIDQILDFVHLDSGRLDPRVEEVDLRRLALDAQTIVDSDAGRKGLTIAVDAPHGIRIHTDRALISQVLVGLLSNAVKFSSSGRIVLEATADANAARFTVRDQGIGIAAEHIDRIFEPFWQAERGRTRSAPGLGLGLAVGRRLVHALGGTIRVASQLEKGSEFVVTIPRHGAGAPPSA